MIELEIHQNDSLIMHRMFYEPSLSLDMVLQKAELYVKEENLNSFGECLIRVRFNNLTGSGEVSQQKVDVGKYPKITLPKKDA